MFTLLEPNSQGFDGLASLSFSRMKKDAGSKVAQRVKLRNLNQPRTPDFRPEVDAIFGFHGMAHLRREYSRDDIDVHPGSSTKNPPEPVLQGITSAPAAIVHVNDAVGGGGSPTKRKSGDLKGKGRAVDEIPDSLLKRLAGEQYLQPTRAFSVC
jgi:hypothetical protein